MNTRIKDVLDLLDPPEGFRPWHGGPSLLGSLKGIDAEQAAWKPTPERNSIWNLTLHIGYWKYNIIRKLNPDYPKGFERSPSNFPKVPDGGSHKQWESDKILLRKTHTILVNEIKKFPPDRLDEFSSEKRNYTFSQLLVGIAAHDTYHIGQIQVLKKLYNEQKNR